MCQTDKMGTTVRAHLRQQAKSSGRTPPELIGPPMPERCRYLWDMFLDLNQGRSYGFNGPDPLTWTQIRDWSTLMNVGLQEWEVRVIKALDRTWMKAMSKDASDG